MRQFVPPKLYGIIGKPLGHSLSPLLHGIAFRHLDIPGVLLPWELESEQLPAFVEAMRLLDIQGACVTIPHKQAIIPLLDAISDRAKQAGAVNLIHRDGKRILGDNTDVPGFLSPLKKIGLPPSSSALVLGAGGAARAVVAGLKSLGLPSITVTNRNSASAQALASDFGIDHADWETRGMLEADLVVNTTPLGMKGKFAGETPYRAEWMTNTSRVAYDIVYVPAETRFLHDAATAGWTVINGLEMFLSQADHQFATWTGQHLPEAAKQAVVEALEASR